MPVLLGCIADDFTGATDLANTLVKQGMRTVQTIGVPGEGMELGDAEAIVVALKSRTNPAHEAVEASLNALNWLRGAGAHQFFFKYCSTFDSTEKGNIGPVADALSEASNADIAIVCPAFPQNKRTIYKGHLFVGDQLLSDSSMKDHPLTPMTDASLVRLMQAQSRHPVAVLDLDTIRRGRDAIDNAFHELQTRGVRYAVTDAVADEDLITVGRAAADHKLITGGSGIALALPENFREKGLLGGASDADIPNITGRAIVIAGSCSEATRAQITHAKARWPNAKINIDDIAASEDAAKNIVSQTLDWAARQDANTPLLVYGSADPQEVAAAQEKYGREESGAMMETALSTIATGLVDAGARQVIVAGGETSGAVVNALGVTGLRIAREIDPGVPWTETMNKPRLALALKSGNFGAENFFEKALGMLP